MRPVASTLDILWAHAQQGWDEISIDQVNHQIGRKNSRLLAVKSAKGKVTGY